MVIYRPDAPESVIGIPLSPLLSMSAVWIPRGLAPQKVADSESLTATGWIMQRKTFYDGSYFWVLYYYGYDPETERYPDYAVSSIDGITWSEPQGFVSRTTDEYMYLGQGSDVRWDSGIGKLIVFIPYLDAAYWARCGTSGGVLTRERLHCPAVLVNFFIVAPRHGYIEDYVLCYHQAVYPAVSLKRNDMIAYHTRDIATNGWITSAPYPPVWGTYSDENGGSLTLTREVGGEDQAIYVVKDGDNTLWWGYLRTTFITYPPTSLATTLAGGLSSLSGCSETELGLGTGKQHIVYIKSTGELCHMSFDGAWSVERILVKSGASYPVIACGEGGRLYVFYVKDGKIWVKHFNGKGWYPETELFVAEHTYDNPAHLSSNQVVQDGKICLVWTEGTSSPYEVWFCYLED